MPKTCYVAEIDENGHIVCVWIKPKEKRNACVFDPNKHIFDHTRDADYFGAKPMAVKSWLAAKRMDGSFNG